MKKRVLPWLLSFCLVLTLVSPCMAAGEGALEQEETIVNRMPCTDENPGAAETLSDTALPDVSGDPAGTDSLTEDQTSPRGEETAGNDGPQNLSDVPDSGEGIDPAGGNATGITEISEEGETLAEGPKEPDDREAHWEDSPEGNRTEKPAEAPNGEALYHTLTSFATEEKAEKFAAGLTEEETTALIEYIHSLPAEKEESRRESAAVGFTNAAPLLKPVTGSRPVSKKVLSAQKTAGDGNAELSNDAVKLDKRVSGPDENSVYTISMEAYVTGKKTVTTTETQIPADIVLVLDQSGSMTNDFPTAYSDEAYSGQTHTNLEMYNNRDNLYAKIGDEYVKVSVWWENYDIIFHNYHYSYTYNGNTVTFNGTEGSARNNNYPSAFCNLDFYLRRVTSSISRLQALKNAVTAFVGSVQDKAKGADGNLGTSDDVNYRVAIVGFAYDSSSNYTNTELFVGSSAYAYNAGSQNDPDHVNSAQSHYCDALQSLDGSSTGHDNLISSIGQLVGNGGTITNLGVEMAGGILAANPLGIGEQRNRVVIVFTDGIPGMSGFDNDVATSAISEATAVKTAGATVYTIGIFEGADATSAGNSTGSDDQKANWFMQTMSSNNGTPQEPSYYLSAGDSDGLNNVFQSISGQIETGGSDITVDESTVIRDILSPYFLLREETEAESIVVKTAGCTGKEGNSFVFGEASPYTEAEIRISDNGKELTVSNFDFGENYVAEVVTDGEVTGYRGEKLIIEIPIVLNRGSTIGGNGIPTNGAHSGMFLKDGTELAGFCSPTVDIPLQYALQAEDQSVYLGTEAQLPSLPVPDVNGENNAYVTIAYTLKDVGGEEIAVYTVPAGRTYDAGTWNSPAGTASSLFLSDCTTYAVSCRVTPTKQGIVSAIEAETPDGRTSAPATVHVFKPVLTVNDVWADQYTEIDLAENCVSKEVIWSDKHIGAALPSGPAPAVSAAGFSLHDADNATRLTPREDIPVCQVTHITINGNTYSTGFSQENAASSGTLAFAVHLNRFSLCITKTVPERYAGYKQSFLFRIAYGGGIIPVVITPEDFTGNTASKTVVGFLCGSQVSVTEETGWSWRYTEGEVTMSASTVTHTGDQAVLKQPPVTETIAAAVQNRLTNCRWLSYEDRQKNFYQKVRPQ